MHFPDGEFDGIVSLQHWNLNLDGREVRGYRGKVSILPGNKVVDGFELTGKDANWIARVAGEASEIYVPGCQVHAVYCIKDSNKIAPNPVFMAVP